MFKARARGYQYLGHFWYQKWVPKSALKMGTKIGASGQVLVPRMGPFFGSHFGNHKWGLKYKVNNGPRSGSQNENQIWTPNWVPPSALRGRKEVPKIGPFFGSQIGHPQFAFLGPPSTRRPRRWGKGLASAGCGNRASSTHPLRSPSSLPSLPRPSASRPLLPTLAFLRLYPLPSSFLAPSLGCSLSLPFRRRPPFLDSPSLPGFSCASSGAALRVTVRTPLF